MPDRSRMALVVLALAVLVVIALPFGDVVAQRITEVFVTNLPDVLRVTGEVNVANPVTLAKQISIEDIVVSPVRPTDTNHLIDAGSIATDGFTRVVLSLDGLVKGDVARVGDVGAFLIPDVDSVRTAFLDQGLLHFVMRVDVEGVSAKNAYFASKQAEYAVGFHNYRVMLYNTTDKTVTANLYIYLTR